MLTFSLVYPGAHTLHMLDKLRVVIELEQLAAHRMRLRCTLAKEGGSCVVVIYILVLISSNVYSY